MNLLTTTRGRRWLFAALYVSEGAPIGFLWWALPPKLRAARVSVPDITALTALLVLPWTFKFLWAPLVDRFRFPRFGLRVWIIGAQLAMGATLLPLIGVDFARELHTVWALLLLHAFAAATQDVAVDALAVATVDPADRGKLNAYTQTGMLAGRALFGGGAVLLEARFGMTVVLLGLVSVTWASLVLVFASLGEGEPSRPGIERGRFSLWSALRRAFATRSSLIALAFALLGGAGFEAVGAVAGPFLVDRAVDSATVGVFFSLPVVVAMVTGSLFGGHVADRVGHVRTVRACVWLVAASILLLCLGDALGLRGFALLGLLTLVYLGIGAFVASSYALFMDLTDPRVAATQFSAYMGATNGCEAWAGWAAGVGVASVGYGPSMAVLAAASLVSLPLLGALRRERPASTLGGHASTGATT